MPSSISLPAKIIFKNVFDIDSIHFSDFHTTQQVDLLVLEVLLLALVWHRQVR